MALPPYPLQIRAGLTAHDDFYLRLGHRIAVLRHSVGLSQEKLGERANVGSSYVAHIEIGGRKPTIDVLRRIADAVDVPLWRLLTDDRFTTDEKAWDATARELAGRVRGLTQQDLQALTYLATRLQAVEAAPKIVRAVPPRTSSIARAAGPSDPRLGPLRRSKSQRAR